MKTFLLFTIISCCALTIHAHVIYIPADHPTIQAGIEAANTGDTVLVENGTYMENINFKGKAVTLASLFIQNGNNSHINNTIIDGSTSLNPDFASTIYMEDVSGTSVISGLTITGGRGTMRSGPSRAGGGVLILNSACVLDHCVIEENNISNNFVYLGGGGIYFHAGDGKDLTIRNCTIWNNSLTSEKKVVGAGIRIRAFNTEFCRILIEKNLIYENTATGSSTNECAGAGIALDIGLPTNCDTKIRNNIIRDNVSIGSANAIKGGAIQIRYYEPGGIFTDLNPSPEIYNNIITNNSAPGGRGGAIGILTNWNTHTESSHVVPQPVLINNTITGNISAESSGLLNWRSFPLLMNNIFWDSSNFGGMDVDNLELSGYENNGVIYAYHNNIREGLEGVYGAVVDSGNINADPEFLDDSYNLSVSSSCVGRGIESIVKADYYYEAPKTDFNGDPRPNPHDNLIDMGAIEMYATSSEYVKRFSQPTLRMYPNPTEDVVYIKSDQAIASLEIFNLAGVRLIHRTDEKERISLGQLERGIYMIRIRTDMGGTCTGKLIRK